VRTPRQIPRHHDHHPNANNNNKLTSLQLVLPPSLPTRSNQQRVFQSKDVSDSDAVADPSSVIWLPPLRKVMAGVALAGTVETGFLTVQKFSGNIDTLCGVDGNCNNVLQGPYSTLPFTDVPLSLVGLLAYMTVAVVAIAPLLDEERKDDVGNRVALTTLTTAMATFSVGLMIILFGVLETTCPYCIFSASCSVILATLAWIGGCLPKNATGNGPVAGFMASTIGAVLIFVSGTITTSGSADLNASSLGVSTSPSTVLASSSTKNVKKDQLFRPPEITTESSLRAMQLATQLEQMDAKLYGAYWCSHCFDQKEALGKQAFGKIIYVECSKDGINSQTKLCKTQQIPGYPTWEIQGQFYPGEQSVEELEELVQTIQQTAQGVIQASAS
jgi:uncharacterized membrane protein